MSANTTFPLLSKALAGATSTPTLSIPTTTPSSHGLNQNTQNILFGSLAAVLALAAIIIGIMQLRQYKLRHNANAVAGHGDRAFELVETLYVVDPAKQHHDCKTDFIQHDGASAAEMASTQRSRRGRA